MVSAYYSSDKFIPVFYEIWSYFIRYYSRVHSQRIVVSGHQFLIYSSLIQHTVAVIINVFRWQFVDPWMVCFLLLYLVIISLGPCPFFLYLRAFWFSLLPHNSLMVNVASSSKSNPSHSKSTRPAFKTGPPVKKPAAVSIAKAKKTKQESIKKHAHTG